MENAIKGKQLYFQQRGLEEELIGEKTPIFFPRSIIRKAFFSLFPNHIYIVLKFLNKFIADK